MLNKTEDDGFLIGLDLAVKVHRAKASGASSKTGTRVFIMSGALYCEDYDFMHDLELFFYCRCFSSFAQMKMRHSKVEQIRTRVLALQGRN